MFSTIPWQCFLLYLGKVFYYTLAMFSTIPWQCFLLYLGNVFYYTLAMFSTLPWQCFLLYLGNVFYYILAMFFYYTLAMFSAMKYRSRRIYSPRLSSAALKWGLNLTKEILGKSLGAGPGKYLCGRNHFFSISGLQFGSGV